MSVANIQNITVVLKGMFVNTHTFLVPRAACYYFAIIYFAFIAGFI